MAKLKSIKFYERGKDGHELAFTSDVTVNQDGTFNITIPDELEVTAKKRGL